MSEIVRFGHPVASEMSESPLGLGRSDTGRKRLYWRHVAMQNIENSRYQ